MKMMFCIHGLGNGGTESFVISAITDLKKRNYDISVVIAVDDNQRQFREDEVEKLNIPIFRTCDLNNIFRKIKHFIRLYKLLKKEKPDVFHSNMDLLNGVNLFASKLAGIKVRVSHSHTSDSQYENDTGKHFLVSIYRFIMRKFIWAFSNRRIGCSNLAMDYLYTDKWKKDKHSYIVFNGIDLEKFNSMNDYQINEKKHLLNIKDEYIICTVGRIQESKNSLFIVDVLSELKKRNVNFKFFWIGKGDQLEAVKVKAREMGVINNIVFLGARKDVNELLQCFDCFLLPSKFEGFPISVIEAQTAGLKCIVSSSITKDINCGLCRFLSTDDAENWANEIILYCERNNGEKYRADTSVYSAQKMVDRLLNIYEIKK